MKSIRYHIMLIVATATLFIPSKALSQQISTEVEIRYEETPQLTDLNKLTLTPSLTLPSRQPAILAYSTRNPQLTLPGSITTLDPAGYADSIYESPYRGYAALGFMPRFNLGVSAGYKFLNTDHTRLNAFLQYDGTSYKPSGWENLVKNNSATIGATLHQAVGKESFIDVDLDYTFASHNNFITSEGSDPCSRTVNRLNASALWSVADTKKSYGAGIAYRYFNYSRRIDQAPRENNIRAKAFFRYNIDSRSIFSLKANLSSLSTPLTVPALPENTAKSYASTLLRLSPTYRYDSQLFNFNIGVNCDITFGNDKGFHLAPDLQATWTPRKSFRVFLQATGGVRQNSLASLYEVSPYSPAARSFSNSYVPFDVDLGITLGSWKGFYAQAVATVARANDWLIPVAISSGLMTYKAVDITGLKIKAEVGYSYRNIARIKASWEMSPTNKHNRGYYLWRDRAKTVVGASLTVTPISPLDIDIDWSYRGNRSMLTVGADDSTPGSILLGSVNSLNAGALYRIKPQWSAFIRGENLLNHQCQLIGLIPAQGRTGLVGVTYKF